MKNNWPIVKLAEVIDRIESGRRPKGGGSGITGIASVGVENLTYDNHFNFTKIKQISNEFFESLKQGKIQSNDILVAKDGATTGKVVLVDDEFPYRKAAVNEHIFILRTKPEKMIQNYLFPLLFSAEGQRQIKLSIHGAAQGGIDKSFVNDISIPVPPLKIQQKIVERLDTIHKAQELNDFQISRTQELFKSLLEKNFSNTHSEHKKLSDICDVRDGTHESPKYKNEGIPLITSKNLKNGNIDFNNVNYISSEDHEKIIKRSFVENGDILFGMIGTIGNPVLVNTEQSFSIKNVGLIKFLDNNINRYYLNYYLQSEMLNNHITQLQRGGTQKFVSLGDLRNLVIPIAPIMEQYKIVKKLDAIQNYKKLLLKQKFLLKELFDSVLHKSMNGEMDGFV